MGEQKEVPEIQSFEEFWPYYLEEHSQRSTRRLHQFGTTLGLSALGVAILRRKKRYIPLGLVLGYGPAWVGHFFIEKNKPATFDYPLWSFLGDLKMNRLLWAGQLEPELERYGIGEYAVMHARDAETDDVEMDDDVDASDASQA